MRDWQAGKEARIAESEVREPGTLENRLAANLERSLEILEALREMKAGLYRSLHPELSDEEIRDRIAWEAVRRKEDQWKSTPASPTA
ncbi:MAG: hypothetical protein KA419_03230 [Acidobacteria bacterium]|nr:hypothetical protein [Acidobacteriota bacterium]